MLGFKLGDQWLDLDEKTSLTLTLLNPIFDKEGLQRVFSYSLSFPTTPHNNAQFEHNYRIDARGGKYYSVVLYLQDIRFEEGIFTLNNTVKRRYSGVLSNEQIIIARKYKATRLRDLSMPETIPLNLTGTNTLVTVNSLTAKRCSIGIDGQLFANNKGEPMATIVDNINAVYPGIAAFVSSVVAGQAETLTITLTWPNSTTPIWVDTTKTTNVRYSLFSAQAPIVRAATAVNVAWQQKLNNLKTNPTTHCFPVVKNEDLYDGKNPIWSKYINYTTTAGNVPIGALTPSKQWAHTLVPYVFAKEVLRVMAALENLDLAGDWYTDTDMDECVVHSNITLDDYVTEIWGTGGNGNGWYNPMKQNYNLADHLPDISAFDYLQYLRSNFFLYYNVDNGRLEINTIQSQLLSDVEDWTAKVDPNFRKNLAKKEGLDFDYNYDRSDDPERDNLQLLPLALAGDDLVPPLPWRAMFFSLFMKYDIDEQSFGQTTERDWIVPTITEVGVSEDFGLKNEVTPRLLFWKGMHNDTEGIEYPLATSQDINIDGDDLGPNTLNITGEKGLYERRGKEFLRLLTDGDVIPLKVRLTIADLLKLKKWQSVRKHIYTQDGSFVGIVKSVKIKASMLGIESSTVEFVKE